MNNPPPDKADTLERIGDLSEKVARVLVKAVRRANDFFSDGKRFAPNLFADLVRYHAQDFFRTEQLETQDDDDIALEAQAVANLGLQLFSKSYLFKVLRSGANGSPPIPQTFARIAFYNQQLSYVPDPRTNTFRPVELNLLYLWDYNSERELSSVVLYCPKTGGRAKSEVTKHWAEPIALPFVAEEATDRRRRTIEERRDLDISAEPAATSEDFPADAPEEEKNAQDDSDAGNY